MSEELAVSRELVAKIRRQLIEGNQIPNNPGRVGSDGKLYTSAGIPREQPERPQGKPEDDEDNAERGRRGMGAAAAPWEETDAAEGQREGAFDGRTALSRRTRATWHSGQALSMFPRRRLMSCWS